ncbi:MAG: peptidylprolyl isomerase [Burkholderiaceae bacterium]|jgi:peptidyl-prolyl cis-trans isomerase C|nr:peptidylprolyl isomerase [Burkholderiaceae bacterium]
MQFIFRMALASAAVSACCLAAAQGAPDSPPLVTGPAGQVTLDELDVLAKEMVPPARRTEFWSNPEQIGQLARSIYAQRALAQDALKEGLDKSAEGAAHLKLTRERALTELVMQQRVRAKTPNDKALDTYARSEYKAKPERFVLPEQVHARHILLAVAADGSNDAAVKAKAQELIAELRKGADFAKLASTQSIDKGSAARGGDLGFFARGSMVPEFEQAAFALQKKGDLSAPVKTQFGYHIIELIEHKAAGTQSFEEALPILREELLGKVNTEERMKAWRAAEGAGKVNDEEIARLAKAKGQKS